MNEVRYLATGTLFLSDEGPMLETLDHTIRIGNTPTFLYFDLYIHRTGNTEVTFGDVGEECANILKPRTGNIGR